MHKPERILCIRGGGLGDFILTIPLLRALRRKNPRRYLEVWGHLAYARLASGLVDKVRSLDSLNLAPLFSRSGTAEKDMSPLFTDLGSFQIAISFLVDHEGLFQRNLSRYAEQVLVVSPPDPRGTEHASDYFIREIAPLGVLPPAPLPEIALPPPDPRAALERMLLDLLAEPEEPFVTVHPGSGSPRKNWPAENFAEVIRWFLQDLRTQVLLVSGKADRTATRAVLEMTRPLTPPHLQDASVSELASLLRQTRLYLGNDSGISHLAAACGAPSIVMFGPTAPRVWAPRGRQVRIIEDGTIETVRKTVLELLC